MIKSLFRSFLIFQGVWCVAASMVDSRLLHCTVKLTLGAMLLAAFAMIDGFQKGAVKNDVSPIGKRPQFPK